MQAGALGPIFKMLKPGAKIEISSVLVAGEWAIVELKAVGAITKTGGRPVNHLVCECFALCPLDVLRNLVPVCVLYTPAADC